jgi:hypothetical protein
VSIQDIEAAAVVEPGHFMVLVVFPALGATMDDLTL